MEGYGLFGKAVITGAALWISLLIPASPSPAAGNEAPPRPSLENRLPLDSQAVHLSRMSLNNIVAFMAAQPDLFPSRKGQALRTREQRLAVWNVWQAFLDHILALDSIGRVYAEFDEFRDDEQKKAAFRLAFAVFLAQYRFSLDFIAITEKDSSLHVILNEAVPELGLDANAYAALKNRFLNVKRGAEFARLNVVYRFYGPDPTEALTPGIEEDTDAVWKAGKGRGPVLTVQNAFRVIHDTGFTAWFPVQKGVARWMGDTKVWRKNNALISETQIDAMKELLQPGDIILERREWYLSNIGLPGFWPHAALYIGTPEERRVYFEPDQDVRRWVQEQGIDSGDLEDLLQRRYAAAYRLSKIVQEEKHPPRVVEAVDAGVVFSTLEHTAEADSLAVLRPRLPKKEKAQAIARAFHYNGRPYDFNFDFLTDAALVCSELVYKAYEPSSHGKGLRLPVKTVLGRPVISPNEYARLFDEEYDGDYPQCDLVLFLDGDERTGRALLSDAATFRTSWRRPKWHILMSHENPGGSSPESAPGAMQGSTSSTITSKVPPCPSDHQK